MKSLKFILPGLFVLAILLTLTGCGAKKYSLTFNYTGSGTINLNPGGNIYKSGATVTLNAIPEANWVFDHWEGDLTGNTNPKSIIMNSNKSVSAVFIQPNVKWLFLVYMDGDNNLEPEAIKDLNEMEQVGSSNDVNILVLFDRSPGFDTSNGNWSGTRLYKVTRDNNQSTISSQLQTASPWGKSDDSIEADMSNPNTLRDFVIYCRNHYPAAHTVLTLWDHGNGVWPKSINLNPVSKTEKSAFFPTSSGNTFTSKGICWDDTTGLNYWNCLTTDEVATALREARAQTLEKIDLINTDACLMQMIEVAYEWKDETDYLAGSEETVPGDGNSYNTLLNRLANNPEMSVEEFAVNLVDDYYAFYNGSGFDTTYSALKFGAPLDTLISSFTTLATKLKDTTDLNGVYNAWFDTSFFGDQPEISDLYDFASKLVNLSADPQVVDAAVTLRNAFNGLVVNHRETGIHISTSTSPAYGLAFLLPSSAEWGYYSDSNQYVSLNLCKDTDWDEFIARFVTYTSTLK